MTDAETQDWTHPIRTHKPPTEELRVALAMRGGVSLAVWIGGAVAELDLLRRGVLAAEAARQLVGTADIERIFFAGLPVDGLERERVKVYARTIGPAYTSIRVDVLAGASAGGLNAVLYGVAQTLGMGVEWMRSTWMDEGDLWTLMRPGWRPGEAFRVESLLTGETSAEAADVPGFYERVLEQIRSNASSEGADELVAEHVSVNLAATLEAGPAVQRSETRSTRPPEAHFHFRKFPRRPGAAAPDDMPTGVDDLPRLRRLAYAARTTSSFPGAFEPARLWSYPPTDAEVAEDKTTSESRPLNFYGTFSETTELRTGATPDLFRVFDGGVFDNIPIKRALDAIADMPADVKVQRHLLYLDPDPPDLAQPPGVGEAPRLGELSTFFVTMAGRALSMKVRSETAQEDVAIIRAELADRDEAVRRRKVEFTQARATLTDGQQKQVWGRYASWRAEDDAERIVDAAVRPGPSTLRSLMPSAVTDTTLSEEMALALRLWLRRDLKGVHKVGLDKTGETPPACASDARSLFLACGHLISEADSGRADGMRLMELWARRQRLQLIRAAAARFADAADLAALACGQSMDFERPPKASKRMAARYAKVAHDGLGSEATPVDVFRGCLEWRVLTRDEQSELESRAVGNPWAVDEAVFWRTLMGLPTDEPFARHHDALWELTAEQARALAPALQGLGLKQEGTADHLRMLSAHLCTKLGVPVLQSLRTYACITASAPALPGIAIGKIKADARKRAVETLVGLPSKQLTKERTTWQLARLEFTAQSKLAGNQLGNFAGFLDSSWRRHDFEWGRRDAAEMIMRPPAQGTGLDIGQGPFNKVSTAGEPDLLRWSDEDLDRARYGLGDLSFRRRIGLTSRVVQLLQRAVWPLTWKRADGDAAWKNISARNVVLAFVLLALRLPLSVLPLVLVARLRLAALVVTGMLSVRFVPATPHALGLGEGTTTVDLPGSPPGAFGLVLLALLGGAGLARIFTVARKWRRVRSHVGDAKPQLRWAKVGLVSSVLTLAVMLVATAAGVAGWRDVSGFSVLQDGWRASTWFERLLVFSVLAVAATAVPSALMRVTELKAWADPLRLLVAVTWPPAVVVGLTWWLSVAPSIETPEEWWKFSAQGSGIAVAAAVSGLLVVACLAGWSHGGWTGWATATAITAVIVADMIVGWCASEEYERYAVAAVVVALLLVLIVALQAWGQGASTVAAVTGVVVASTGAAVLGQLLFQSTASLGVPFGLWQGVFVMALMGVFVQPAKNLEKGQAVTSTPSR